MPKPSRPRRQWIKDLLVRDDRKQAELARFLGIPPQRMTDLISGKRTLSAEAADGISKFFKMPLRSITTMDKNPTVTADSASTITPVPLVGTIGGRIMTDEPMDIATGEEDILAPREMTANGSFAMTVSGPEMNRVYKDGTIVICSPAGLYGGLDGLADGDIVVAESTIEGGYIYHLRQVERSNDGRVWLWPRSTDPALQPIEMSAAADAACRVIAVVNGEFNRRKALPVTEEAQSPAVVKAKKPTKGRKA